MLLLIILLVLLFGGGGGYYGYSKWGRGGGLGIVGTVLLIVLGLATPRARRLWILAQSRSQRRRSIPFRFLRFLEGSRW